MLRMIRFKEVHMLDQLVGSWARHHLTDLAKRTASNLFAGDNLHDAFWDAACDKFDDDSRWVDENLLGWMG